MEEFKHIETFTFLSKEMQNRVLEIVIYKSGTIFKIRECRSGNAATKIGVNNFKRMESTKGG